MEHRQHLCPVDQNPGPEGQELAFATLLVMLISTADMGLVAYSISPTTARGRVFFTHMRCNQHLKKKHFIIAV
jgi:hypothetical protein